MLTPLEHVEITHLSDRELLIRHIEIVVRLDQDYTRPTLVLPVAYERARVAPLGR